MHELPEGVNASEFVLASAKSRSWEEPDSDSSEYLLTYTHDITGSHDEVKTRTSSFYVVNARNMTCQAVVALPTRVPFGFHGTFYQSKL